MPIFGTTARMAARRFVGAAATTGLAGGAWVGYHVGNGNLNYGGSHRYDREWRLGPAQNYGGAEQFWRDLRTSPNGRFPMTRVDGVPNQAGARLALRFAFERPNIVRVEEVDQTSMLLSTQPGEHLFQGTARHSVREAGGDLVYRIEGEGPSDNPEDFMLQIANVAFAQAGWMVNMPFSDSDQERALAQSLLATGQA